MRGLKPKGVFIKREELERLEQKKVAIVGIGKLGSALMKHWDENERSIGVYHPDQAKANNFSRKFSHGYVIEEKNFDSFDIVVLCLPPASIVPFLKGIHPAEKTLYINMATSVNTKDIRAQIPSLNILGIKYMGQAGDLLQNGNGLFISEKRLTPDLHQLFAIQGEILQDDEERLNEANTAAAYYALRAAVELQELFNKRGFPELYAKRALESTIPGVIRSYSDASLGHFALKILEDVKKERTEKNPKSAVF
jgi:pyrroline-5-carboxylate reductase